MTELQKLIESQPINEGLKSDLYVMVTFLKLASDYAAVLRKCQNVKREAKQIFTDVTRSADSFIARLRAGISSESGKRGFTEAWEHDYHSWGNIVRFMSCMNPEQLDAVDTFCEQMLSGGVRYEEETKNESLEVQK